MKIKIQNQQIKYNTGRAQLITVPHTKYLVWIPNSLIKPKYWFFEAFLPEKMTFTLIHKQKKEKCSASTLYSMFEHTPDGFVDTIHIPEKLSPKKVDVDDSLKR